MLCQINISVDDFNFTHHAYIFKISWEEHEWNVIFVVRKLLKWWQPLQKKNEAVNLNPDSSFGLCAFLFLRFHSVFLVVRCRCWIVTLRTYMVPALTSSVHILPCLLVYWELLFFPRYLNGSHVLQLGGVNENMSYEYPQLQHKHYTGCIRNLHVDSKVRSNK